MVNLLKRVIMQPRHRVSIFLLLGVCLSILSCIYKGRSLFGTPKTVDGQVLQLTEGGTLDAVFKLDDANYYYINRGLENLFTIDQLNELTLGKSVRISYIDMGSMHADTGNTWHLTKLSIGDSVIYDEAKEIPEIASK